MHRIPLRNSPRVVLVDDADFQKVSKWGWTLVARQTPTRTLYYAVSHKVMMHRLIMDAPPKMIVNHRTEDGLDNRRENLRLCTPSQNAQNKMKPKKADGTSRFKGVYYKANLKKKPWLCCLTKDGKQIFGGYYTTALSAAERYNVLALEHFGEFAKLNDLGLE